MFQVSFVLFLPSTEKERQKFLLCEKASALFTLILVGAALKVNWRNYQPPWSETDFFLKRTDKNNRIVPLFPPSSVHYAQFFKSPRMEQQGSVDSRLTKEHQFIWSTVVKWGYNLGRNFMVEFRGRYLKGFAIWADLSRQRANCIQTRSFCTVP